MTQESAPAMVFANIEKIKQEYTDKYVVVDPQRPELARFRDVVGQVKTVNMNGNALVEFFDYHLNIGWYDISLDFLKVVDKPEPKAKEKPAAKQPAAKAPSKPAAASAEKKMSPLEMARAQGAAGKAGGGESKPSTADILAAARGGAAPAAKKEPAAPAKPAAAEKPAAGKVDRSKMSVAEMIAAARGGSAPAAKEELPKPEPAPAAEPEPEVAAEPIAEAAEPAESKPAGGKVDRNAMSVEEMLAYCREHDAG